MNRVQRRLERLINRKTLVSPDSLNELGTEIAKMTQEVDRIQSSFASIVAVAQTVAL